MDVCRKGEGDQTLPPGGLPSPPEPIPGDRPHGQRKGLHPRQLDAWAPAELDPAAWDRSFSRHITLVALEEGEIVGFADADPSGVLDRLFVHKDHQRQGIASALCAALEKALPASVITTEASLTARPFFTAQGYRVVKTQQVERRGVLLENAVMRKEKI